MPQHGPPGAPHGLLTQQAGGPAPAPAPAAAAAPAPQGPVPQGQGQIEEETPNVSPEEQAIYDQFVEKAFAVIYDQKALPQIIESLRGDGNPVEGLANTAVNVVVRVEDAAKKAGQKIPGEVIHEAGREILEDLSRLATEAGVHEFTTEEVEGAWFQSMDLYRERKGRDGGENSEEIAQDFKKLQEINQAGRLDEVVPGLSQRFGGPGGGVPISKAGGAPAAGPGGVPAAGPGGAPAVGPR